MRWLAFGGILGLVASAHAEAVVEGSVSAGTTAGARVDHQHPTAGTGFGLADAQVTAHVTRAPVPLDERGLHMCSVDGSGGCLWVFTGLDPTARDGAGVEASSRLLYAATGEVSSDLQLDARAWAGAAGWRVEGRSTFQATTTLRDRFWRSNRGVVHHAVGVEVPAMWAIGSRDTQLLAMRLYGDVGARSQRQGESWHAVGFDRELGVVGGRIQTRHITADLVTLRYAELGTAERQVGATTYGTSVVLLDVDVIAAQARLPHGIELHGRAGVADRMPLAPFEETGSTSRSSGDSRLAPSYWVEARRGSLDDAAPPVALTVGGGSWLRLEPSGHAVDAGHLVTVAVLVRGGRLTLRADGQLGALRRVLVGALAPMELAPVGTRSTMGRGTLHGSFAVTRSLAITGSTWLEHSDRADPRWAPPPVAATAPTTHAGGELSAVWSFERARR
ncbi:MAG: hypothetical protein M3680_28730 [Myxococcota bacterium]|nr:hypothetical protein [Myxococcota bacterium]